MHYQPVKDSILIGTSALLVGVILAFTFGFKPREDSLHVEIRYQNTLLFDPLDPSKNTSISFPESGERNIVFHKEDGHLFLGEGVDFLRWERSHSLTPRLSVFLTRFRR